MQFQPTIKQYIALMKLGAIPKEKIVDWEWTMVYDKEWLPIFETDVEVLGYWGAAWWGKSVLISRWLKQMCETYPWTRWFMARNELKRLKTSTLLTFFDLLNQDWYVRDGKWLKWYNYNDIKGSITFNNGSVIHLIELWYQPSDPLYWRIGSTEYTWGAIDEASEIELDWFEVANSRIRFRLESFCHACAGAITPENKIREDKFDNPEYWTNLEVTYSEEEKYFTKNVYLCPHCKRETHWLTWRIICCFNPDKSWVYWTFYRRFADWTLPKNYAFIPALPWDNPHLSKSYIKRLYGLSDIHKQRLLYGNFEYDDTPWRLFNYDTVLSWFNKKTTSELIEEEFKTNPWLELMVRKVGYVKEYWYDYKMIVDPARMGSDLAIIVIMNHLSVEKVVVYGKSTIDELEIKCLELMERYQLTPHDVVVDEWWVWWWLKDRLKCVWFIAHSTPIQPREKKRRKNELDYVSYHRLRDQCYHILSTIQNDIAISLKDVTIYNSQITVEQLRKSIIEDMDSVVQVDIDKDTPFKVITKQELKKKIGRSPDFWDVLMMAMIFRLKKSRKVFVRMR